MEKTGNILMEKYEFGKLLGQGNFAKVYHARNIATGQSVAIKVIDKEKVLKVGLIEQTKREISVMRLVKQPNVVHLYEVMATKSKVYYVMEYAKGGELFNKVAKGRLKEDAARKYFQQLITALDYCHSRGVYHRDLKPENLLLDENGVLKISDFGLSALAESKHQDGLLHTTCGTPAYVAPEVISRKGYDGSKADIWSCGVILFVLLSGYLPFHDSNLMEMYRKISRGRYKCPTWFNPEVKRLLSRIMDPNPKTRISIAMIMENTWFKMGMDSVQGSGGADVVERGCYEAEKKASCLNAFDIISLSSGFDLSGLFTGEGEGRKEAKFTSGEPADVIVSKFEEMAGRAGMRVVGKEGGGRVVRMVEEGGVRIEAEIFEVTSALHLVEVKWTVGGEVVMRREIGPWLNDIVLAWQGGVGPIDALQQHTRHLILPAF